jgi:hypothetical protein
MPQPIVPIHKQESMPIIFGESGQPEFHLSELQAIVLQTTASTKNNTRYSINTIAALQEIDKNTDFVVTAVTDSNERYCSVPSEIDENTMLTLKAEGLISGYGRSVKITDRGRTALRDAYLSTKNSLKENRTSEKFDFRSFSRIANKNGE